MFRAITTTIVPVMACVGLSPAQAAPVSTNYAVKGTVPNSCALSSTSIGLTVSRATGNTITVVFSPSSNPTASCNAAAGGALSLSSTRLQKQGGAAQDYTVRLTGWNGNMDYTTASPAPAPTKASKSGVGTTTLTLSCQSGCGTNQINTNSTYTATITLGLAPNP
jgi:hypothetical protein